MEKYQDFQKNLNATKDVTKEKIGDYLIGCSKNKSFIRF